MRVFLNKLPIHALCAAAALALTLKSPAAEIQGVSIAAVSGNYSSPPDLRFATNLVSGIGLFGDVHGIIGPGDMWLATTTGQAATNFVTFNLGGLYTVNALKVWNYNEAASTEMVRGIKSASISFSTDGLNFTTNIAAQPFNEAPGLFTNFAQIIAMPSPVVAQYVRINVITNWATTASGVGLSKVRIISNTNAPTVLRAAENYGSNQVTVYFSESVDTNSATTLGNYSITGSGAPVTISSVAMGAFADRVVLQTSHLANQNYSVAVSGVYDEALTAPVANNSTVAVQPEVFLWLMGNQGVETNSSGTLTEWEDQSAYGHNALPTNIFAYTAQPTITPGILNGLPAVTFSGSQVMAIPNDPNNPINGDMALFLVINKTSAVSAYGDPISKTGGTSASTNNLPAPWDFYLNTTAKPDFLWGNADGGTGPSSFVGTSAITLNSFYIITLVVRSTNGACYLNGSLASSGALTAAPWDAGNAIFLGLRGSSKAGGSDNITFQGYLAEVMLVHGTITPLDLANINAYLGGKYAIPILSLGITEQPSSVTAQVGGTAAFWVNAVGPPPLTYQWKSNSVSVAGATSSLYTTPALAPSYNNATYTVTVTSPVGTTNSAGALLTVVPDNTPPTIFSAVKSANLTNVVVAFSESVSNATALNAANYALNGGAAVVSVAAGGASNQVILATTALSTNTAYFLTVQNVKDLASNVILTTNVPVQPASLTMWLRADSGVVTNASAPYPSLVYQWLDQTTNRNNAIQYSGGTAARPALSIDAVDGAPTVTFTASSSNYLQVASSPGVALAGDMTIYAVANFSDYSTYREMLGKTGGAAGNEPAPYDYYTLNGGSGDARLLRGNGSVNASVSASAPAALQTPQVLTVTMAGTTVNHYLNGTLNGAGALNTNTTDTGTPLCIGSRNALDIFMNGNIAEVMLFSNALSGSDRTNVDNYLGVKYFPFTITQPLADVSTTEGQTATFFIGASQGSAHLSYQWQEATTNNPTPTNIANATGVSYTTGPLTPADDGDTFYVLVSASGVTNLVGPATLSVQNVPPVVTSAGQPIWNQNNSIAVLFSEAVNPLGATDAGNYSLNNGASVLSAVMGSLPNEVLLTTSPLTPGVSYTLTVQNVEDLFGNVIVTAGTALGVYPPTTALWLRADEGVTNNAGEVTAWADESGNGNYMAAGTAFGDYPLLVPNAMNGLPAIAFDGIGTYMTALSTPTLAITGDISIFAVIDYNVLGGNTNGIIVSKNFANNKPAPYDYYSSSTSVSFLRGNGTTYASVTSTATPTVGAPHLLDVTMQGTAVTNRLDGSPNGTGAISTTITDQGQPLFIGMRDDAGTKLNGTLAEVIIVGAAVDSNDVFSIENYLATKYALPFAPSIQQPVAATNVDQNSTLVIAATVTGSSPMSLQWYDTNNMAVPNQTNATLVVSNISAGDTYYLYASNAFGATNSTTVAVSVLTGLTVNPLTPASWTAYEGTIFTYAATAFGTAPFSYQWMADGEPVAGATNSAYTLIVPPGTNIFSCAVSNGYNGGTTASTGDAALIGLIPAANLYTQTVLSNNPLAYWRLDEASGSTMAIDQIAGHNAAYTNVELGVRGFNPLLDPDTGAQFGLLAASNSFAGEIDNSGNGITNIDFSQPVGGNGELSVEAWVQSTGAQTLGDGLVTKGYGNGGEQFDLDVYNGFRFFVRDASGTVHGPTSAVIPVAGQWYHVVGVWDGSNGAARLYVNGALSAATTGVAPNLGLLPTSGAAPALPAANRVSIGARTSGLAAASFDLQFLGVMDEVALYNYPLSPSQVQQDYAIGSILLTPSLSIANAGAGKVELIWNGGLLQSATNVAGPFGNVLNAVSPYTAPASNTQQFYRVLNN